MSIQESTLDVLQLYWKLEYYEVKEYATGGLIHTRATVEKRSKYKLLRMLYHIRMIYRKIILNLLLTSFIYRKIKSIHLLTWCEIRVKILYIAGRKQGLRADSNIGLKYK